MRRENGIQLISLIYGGPVKLSRLSAASILTLALLLPAGAALANPAAGEQLAVAQKGQQPGDASAEDLAATVEKATSPELAAEDQPAAPAADGSFTKNGDVAVTAPIDSAKAVTATQQTDTGPVTVTVGTGAKHQAKGVLVADGSVTYEGAGSIDQTIQPTTDGFRIHSVLADASADTEIVHEVTLPEGARLVAEKDMSESANLPEGAALSGAVFIVDAEGEILGGFSSPWAKGANGARVATHYDIRSRNLVQVIDHRGPGTAYPVVADPYLGFSLISSAEWVYKYPYGFTLKVSPTGWARANAGNYGVGILGWYELYKKYRNHGLNTNLGGMRDQYVCHQQFASVKPTWNLDEWRPNVSYRQTVTAACNPGKP